MPDPDPISPLVPSDPTALSPSDLPTVIPPPPPPPPPPPIVPEDLQKTLEEKLGYEESPTAPPVEQAPAVDLPNGNGKKFSKGLRTGLVAGLVAIAVGVVGGGVFFGLRQTSDKLVTTESRTPALENCRFEGDCFVGDCGVVKLHLCPNLPNGPCNSPNAVNESCFRSNFCGTQQLDVASGGYGSGGSQACEDAGAAYNQCLADNAGRSDQEKRDACQTYEDAANATCGFSMTQSRTDVAEGTCEGVPPPSPGESPPPGGPPGQGPAPCTESETCKDGKVCGPTEDCIVRDGQGEFPKNPEKWTWGCKPDKNCVEPSHEPPAGLVCKNLLASAEAPSVGETVTFTCKSDGSNKVDHFEFRYKIGNGNYTRLDNGAAQGEDKKYKGTAQLTITQAGDYKVQCRVCKRADGNCTDWGEAH